MKRILADLRKAVGISLILVLPFILLEWVNRKKYHEEFPYVLFGMLWLLPLIFILTWMQDFKRIRVGKRLPGDNFSLLLKGSVLLVIAWLWVSLLFDQMPCFLGIPNCD